MALPVQTASDRRTDGPDEVTQMLDRRRAVARVLDDSIRIPGTGFRVGLDPLLGLVPVLGDSVALVGSLYIVLAGVTLGVPRRLLARMVLLVGIDWVVGSVPLVGTLFDAVVKVNRRNVATLEAYVARERPDGRIDQESP